MAAPAGGRGCIVLVLGMHRSGTSVMTNCLATAGMWLTGDVLAPDPQINPDGFFEDVRVVELNEALLAGLGRSWMDYRPLPNLQTEPVPGWSGRALAHVQECYAEQSLSVLKDPRLCLTWPYWLPVFATAGLDVAAVHVVRSPLEMATSLKRRDAIPLDYGLLLWGVYVQAAARAQTVVSRSATVAFQALIEAPREALQSVFDAMGLAAPSVSEFDGIVQVVRHSPNLAAGTSSGPVSEDLEALTSRLYATLIQARSPAGGGADSLGSLGTHWQHLLAQYEHRWDALHAVARDLQSLSQRLVEIGGLHHHAQEVVAERDRQLVRVNNMLEQLGHEHTHAQLVVAERDAQLRGLHRELERLQSEVARVRRTWVGRLLMRLVQ